MSNVAISFASLVKSNNGFFKSEAQAKFLLAQCQEENTFITSGTVYRNTFQLFYVCDAHGVVRVDKYLPKSAKTETTFTRLTSEQFEAKKADAVARQQRETELNNNMIAKYQARLDAFQNALTIAQALIKAQMIECGIGEDMAQGIVESTMKDQDSITNSMDVLEQSPEFVKAWEFFNDQPGV